MAKAKDDEKNQVPEKVTADADLLKNKLSSMMELVEDDDEIDEDLMKELKKPKKKFLGLF